MSLQKHDAPAATCDGECCATWSLATCGCRPIRSGALYRATLGRTGEGTASGSRRLGRVSFGSKTYQADRSGDRAARACHPMLAEGPQRVGRIRCGSNSTRDGISKDQIVPVDPHHRQDSPTARRLGWSQANASTGAATRLVSSRRGGQEGRVGQLRHHRRPGHSRRAACGGFYGSFAAWGLGGGLACTIRIRQEYAGHAGGTLARSGAAWLRPIRQRQPLHWTASVSRRHRPRDPYMLEPGCDTRVRRAHRTRLSSIHREFQRSLAGESVVPIRTSFPPRPENSIGQVHFRRQKPHRGTDRIGALAAFVSRTMAIEPARAAARQDHLHPTHQRQRVYQCLGTHLRCGSALAASPCSCRGRP